MSGIQRLQAGISFSEAESIQPSVLLYAESTSSVVSRSGVQRVVRSLAADLSDLVNVDFVKWDRQDGQLRYFDTRDLNRLFDGEISPSIQVNPLAHRVNYRFGETLAEGKRTWIILPEISYHAENGTEIMARIVTMAQEYGARTCGVFYDAIPITNPNYRNLRQKHIEYVAQLLRCDRIYSISEHARSELVGLCAKAVPADSSDLMALRERIVAVPLGVNLPNCDASETGQGSKVRNILILGTVEPRKQQVAVLEAIHSLPASMTENLAVHVVGSLHADSASDFHRALSLSPAFHYHGYGSPELITEMFRQAAFTVFASDDEGFGLPILESIAHGVPCLTANFGAMREVAEGGGCLTTDVRQKKELALALARLLNDKDLLARLRSEAASRSIRRTSEFAQDIVRDMMKVGVAEAACALEARKTISCAIERAMREQRHVHAKIPLSSGGANAVVAVDVGASAEPTAVTPDGAEVRIIAGDWQMADVASGSISSASAWALSNRESYEVLVGAARADDTSELLPGTCIVESDVTCLAGQTANAVAHKLSLQQRRREVATREAFLSTFADRWPDSRDESRPLLSVVISTYNRASFVEANVSWLLKLLTKIPETIKVVVVDNASTDDTVARLARFAGDPRLSLVVNPVNVGMLGNLRVCSALIHSRYVWLTGDDDYIVPAGLAEIIDALKRHPMIPLVCSNFGVYHRQSFAATDCVPDFIAEHMPLARRPSPSGLYELRSIAEEHDNLFTAIYPLVFRSDILSACFNYPFDGKPFADLIESVPTTHMLLSTYAATKTYWCSQVGIVGNLHNSWSAHRPRWHAVLMPQVFALARDAGVNPVKLQQWAAIHFDLFAEAKAIAASKKVDLNIDPAELGTSHQVFRRPIML